MGLAPPPGNEDARSAALRLAVAAPSVVIDGFPDLARILDSIRNDVLCWAGAGGTQSGGGDPVLHSYRGIKGAVYALVRLLRSEQPDMATPAEMSDAARQIARWAEGRDLLPTAYTYSALAAALLPGEPRTFIQAGRLARRRADYSTSREWLKHAEVLAEAQKDWGAYALTFAALGNLSRQLGNFPQARALQEKCLAIALEHGHRELVANAYHDLFIIAAECGDFTLAQDLAIKSFDAYGPDHPKIAHFANDLAFVLAASNQHRSALELLEQLLPVYRHDTNLVLVWAAIAKSAGAIGDRVRYEAARSAVTDLVGDAGDREPVARALLAVAEGASELRAWEEAQEVASAALALATMRREGKVAIRAEAIADAAAAEQRGLREDASTREVQELVSALAVALKAVPAGR